MSVTVSIPTAFRRHTEGLGSFDCPAADLNQLFEALEARFPELKPHLRDEEGKVRRFLNVYVNDEDIRFLGPDYKFNQGDEVTLVPSIAGG
jgi:molybdopterin synthase sulfur carrier subunit